jgi:hypothetical protein
MELTPSNYRGISWKKASPMPAGESKDPARGVRPFTTASSIVIHVLGVEDFQGYPGARVMEQDVRVVAALQATYADRILDENSFGQLEQTDTIEWSVLEEIELLHPPPEIEENLEGPRLMILIVVGDDERFNGLDVSVEELEWHP